MSTPFTLIRRNRIIPLRSCSWEDALGNQINNSFDDDCCTATEIEEVEVLPTTGTHTFRTELILDVLNRVTERRIVDRENSSNKHIFKTKYTSLGVAAESEDAEGNETWRYHDGLGRVYKTEVDLGSSARQCNELSVNADRRFSRRSSAGISVRSPIPR